MLKEQARLFSRASIAVDLLVTLGAFWLAYTVRARLQPPLQPLRDYLWSLLVILPAWQYLLTRYGLNASIRRLSLREICFRTAAVHVWGGVVLAAAVFFFDRQVYSRGLLLLFVGIAFILLLLEKTLVRLGLGWLRRRGYNFRQIIIVGTRDKAARFSQLIAEHADWGLRVTGFVQAVEPPLVPEVGGYPVLGHLRDLVEICKRHPVDEVVFCLPKDLFPGAEADLRSLEELGITVRLVLDFFQVPNSKKELSIFHDELPILTFHTKNLDAHQLLAKRLLDVAGAAVGLALTAVLLPAIALAIRLDSPGPVFFAHRRVGEAGRSFVCWKFRTMYRDAEFRKKDLLHRNQMNGAIFKMRDDPRVTRVGRFLRRTSLDELPQFWNVLKGEMSLVGTRPPTEEEVGQYANWHRRRISIRPGITGLWQVSGRSRIVDFDDIVRLDLRYIDSWSLWLDLKILCKTLGAVVGGRGSC